MNTSCLTCDFAYNSSVITFFFAIIKFFLDKPEHEIGILTCCFISDDIDKSDYFSEMMNILIVL